MALGIAITAGLYLRAIMLAFMGEAPKKGYKFSDLGARETLALSPLLALTVIVGVAPSLVLGVVHATTASLGLGG